MAFSFTKAEAVKKLVEFTQINTAISAEQADAILLALGINPRDYYKSDASSVRLKEHVIEVDKLKRDIVDGGFATDAEVETAKTSLKARK